MGDGFCVVCNWHGTERDLFAFGSLLSPLNLFVLVLWQPSLYSYAETVVL